MSETTELHAQLLGDIRNMLGVTLTANVSELGFAPEGIGQNVKKALASDDPVILLSLGCTLDEAREGKDWMLMEKFFKEIEMAGKGNPKDV